MTLRLTIHLLLTKVLTPPHCCWFWTTLLYMRFCSFSDIFKFHFYYTVLLFTKRSPKCYRLMRNLIFTQEWYKKFYDFLSPKKSPWFGCVIENSFCFQSGSKSACASYNMYLIMIVWKQSYVWIMSLIFIRYG